MSIYQQYLVVDQAAAVTNNIPNVQVVGTPPVSISGTPSVTLTAPVVENGAGVADAAVGAAGAAVSGTLAAVAGKTTRISGFDVSGGTVLVAVLAGITVTGLLNGKTFTYNVVFTVLNGAYLSVRFSQPIPASAVNAAIVVSVPALTGGPAVAVNVWGDYV
jgi:hypothetical protein